MKPNENFILNHFKFDLLRVFFFLDQMITWTIVKVVGRFLSFGDNDIADKAATYSFALLSRFTLWGWNKKAKQVILGKLKIFIDLNMPFP